MNTVDFRNFIVFVGPRPWHIAIRHRVKKKSTINLFGFESIHPVSITRFPLTRFSPGAGLLRNLFYTINAKIFQGLGPKRRESCNGDPV